jgi:hypothetical protein
MALYKFMNSKYVESFLDGKIYCQTLAFYQRHEAQGTVGDKHEAMRIFAPSGGLRIHNITTNTRFSIQAAFISELLAKEIYVFCVSLCDADPKTIDKAYDTVVHIKNMRKFTRRLRTAVQTLTGDMALLSRPVSYYAEEDPPGVNWALPDVIATSKRTYFASQTEHRFAIASRKLMKIGNAIQKIQFGELVHDKNISIPDPITVNVGDIRDLCHVVPGPGAQNMRVRPQGT